MNATLDRLNQLTDVLDPVPDDPNQKQFASPPAPDVDTRGPSSKRSYRILIADDDLAVRHTLARVLEGENYRVVLAKDGQQAVHQFLHAAPDLVLLDINMPDKNGWQAFEVMERSRPLVPIIVITARPDQYPQAAHLGIDALMEKPLNLPVLLSVMEDLLAESGRDRVQRLTDPGFTTRFLNPRQTSLQEGRHQ